MKKEREINIVFLRRSGENFTATERKRIENICVKAGFDAQRILQINEVANFIIKPEKGFLFKGKRHVDAQTFVDTIEFRFPPGKWNMSYLRGAVYHEMCHFARMHVRLREATLLERIFDEGLASTFQRLKEPSYKPPYFEYRIQDLKKYFPRLKKDMDKTDFNHEYWDTKKQAWLKYKLGIYLVKEIQLHHAELVHAKLIRKSAKQLLQLSKVQL